MIKFNCSIRFFLMRVWFFIIDLMELFFYNKIDSIIPTVVLPTTEIIEPYFLASSCGCCARTFDIVAFFEIVAKDKGQCSQYDSKDIWNGWVEEFW